MTGNARAALLRPPALCQTLMTSLAAEQESGGRAATERRSAEPRGAGRL